MVAPGNDTIVEEVTICDSIHKLHLSDFITCAVDNDLSVLTISGSPDKEQLEEAWTNLYNQYIILSDDLQARYFILLQKDILVLHSEIATVETNIYLLSPLMLDYSFDHKEALVQMLNTMGYKINIDFTTDYTPTLQMLEFKLAPKKQRLANKEKELKDYLKDREGKAVDREYFTKVLLRLSKYQGYAIRATDIMTTEFVELLKDYVNYLQSSQPQTEG